MPRNKRKKVDFNIFENQNIDFGCEHLSGAPCFNYDGTVEGLFAFIQEVNNSGITSGIYKIILNDKDLFKSPSPAACHSFKHHLFKIHQFNRNKHWQISKGDIKVSDLIKLNSEVPEVPENSTFYKFFFKSVNFGKHLETYYMNNLIINTQTPLLCSSKEGLNILNMLKPKESKVEISKSLFYFGIKFSPFSWHTEDNFSESINILHEGSSKIWFGIKPKDYEKFNTVSLKRFARANLEHFISPDSLIQKNIPVEYLIQNPGDIIVTVPKGYHSGFSTGPNFSEALNFQFGTDISSNLEFDELFQKNQDPYRYPKFNTPFLLLKVLNNKPEFIPPNIDFLIDKFELLDSRFHSQDQNSKKYDFKNEDAFCSVCDFPVRFSYASCKDCNSVFCYVHHLKCCQNRFKFHKQDIDLRMYLK